MVQHCRNLCAKFYPRKTYQHQNWVENGFRKCMTCKFHVVTEDVRCKCCVTIFRTKVRSKNHSQKYYREVIKPQIDKDKDVIIKWKQNRQRTLKLWKCSICGIEILRVNRTQYANCFDCRMKIQNQYQHEHRALRLLDAYN